MIYKNKNYEQQLKSHAPIVIEYAKIKEGTLLLCGEWEEVEEVELDDNEIVYRRSGAVYYGVAR